MIVDLLPVEIFQLLLVIELACLRMGHGNPLLGDKCVVGAGYFGASVVLAD